MVEKATGIDRFLAEIRKFQGTLAFRGHADSMWKLHSSATRRLIKKYKEDDILEDDLGLSKIYADYGIPASAAAAPEDNRPNS